MKLQKSQNGQVYMNISKTKAELLGWFEALEEGETVEVDQSVTPEKDGLVAREVK